MIDCACRGAGTPESNDICDAIDNKDDCIAKIVIKNENFTASCVWHDNKKYKVFDFQQVTSQGGPLGIVGLDYRGSMCGIRMTVDLPKEAASKWGVNVRLWGGPGTPEWYSTTSPDIPLTSSGCTASKGAPLSCTAELVTPAKYVSKPIFDNNRATLDFFTSVR